MTQGSFSQPLQSLSTEELKALESGWSEEFANLTNKAGANQLALNLSRGKPGIEQVDLSNGLDGILNNNFIAADGTDTRNYGGIRGLAEARALGSQLLNTPADEIIAGGNSSLNLMHLVLRTAMDMGLWGDQRKWNTAETAKILTPVPGYDRHFALSEHFGIESVPIPMLADGPDMAAAKALVAEDASIKGIWCVPKYANPTGCTYSDTVVAAMAQLPAVAKADDFVILWDNAYAVHDLYEQGDSLASIRDAAIAARTEQHVVQFASTSKVTHAGAGVAFLTAHEAVLTALEQHLSFFTIGFDKVNQLRHVKFLNGRLQEHMAAHAAIIRPKFELVLSCFANELDALEIATWTRPRGGYFISLDVMPGLAAKVVAMAKDLGLTLTPAGATFPGGNDPDDRNVRIAPTFGSMEQIQAALDILVLCIKLASAQQLLSNQ